jgi:hypothetical protein
MFFVHAQWIDAEASLVRKGRCGKSLFSASKPQVTVIAQRGKDFGTPCALLMIVFVSSRMRNH